MILVHFYCVSLSPSPILTSNLEPFGHQRPLKNVSEIRPQQKNTKDAQFPFNLSSQPARTTYQSSTMRVVAHTVRRRCSNPSRQAKLELAL